MVLWLLTDFIEQWVRPGDDPEQWIKEIKEYWSDRIMDWQTYADSEIKALIQINIEEKIQRGYSIQWKGGKLSPKMQALVNDAFDFI